METVYEPHNASPTLEYESFSTFYIASGVSAGSHYIDIDAHTENTLMTVYMKNMRILIIRWDNWLTTSGMTGYIATEASLAISAAAGSPTTLQTLNITPDQSGNYLILGYGELDTNSTSDSAFICLNITGGTEYIPINGTYCTGKSYDYMGFEAKDSNDWIPLLIGGIVNLTSGASRTILLEGYRTSTNSAAVRCRRIIAIRLGALTDPNSGEDISDNSFTNTTYSTSYYKGYLSFTPSSAGYYCIIALVAHLSTSASYSSYVRLEHTVGTSPGTIDEEIMRMKQVGTTTQDTFNFNLVCRKELQVATQAFYNEVRVEGGTQYCRMGLILAFQIEETGAPPEEADENIKKFNENLNGMLNNGLN